jgi:uncharacterized protein (TIGR03437 family)
MQRVQKFFFLFFVTAVILPGLPTIAPNSVVNAASYAPPGLPNYGIAQGGMFILKGQNLGAAGTTTANSFPLQTTMGGTSMKIMMNGGSFDVLMVYVVAGQASLGYDQLAGIVPSNVPPGSDLITVTYNGQTSKTEPITVVPSAFGIFTIGQAGIGPGVFTDPSYNVNTLINVAHPNDQLFIWGTGLGPISGSDAGPPPPGNLDVPAEVYVGNVKASIGYQGRSRCCAGIDQILFTIPSGVTGCYVPVVVKIGNIVSNFVTMSIAESGTVCSDPTGYATADLSRPQEHQPLNEGAINMSRLSLNLNIPGTGTIVSNVDQGEAHFRTIPYNGLLGVISGAVAAFRGFPSIGCSVFPYTPDSQKFFNNFLKGADEPGYNSGDAGPQLNFTGPNGSRQLPQVDDGGPAYKLANGTFFGGGLPPNVTPDYLSPGAYRVDDGNGGGSGGIGVFSAMLTIPVNQVNWTNQSAVANISRTQDLTLTMNASGPVAIEGNSANAQAGAGFYCTAPPGTTSFTVPAWVLGALPASAQASDFPVAIGYLAVGTTLASPARFIASGVDTGFFNWGILQVTNVVYQ